MSQYDDSGYKSFVAAEVIPPNSVVTLNSSGEILMCDLANRPLGSCMRGALAIGDVASVKLSTGSGTHKMVANEALAAGALVYTETGGFVQDTAQATAFQVGVAMEAATAQNDVVEVLMQVGEVAAS